MRGSFSLQRFVLVTMGCSIACATASLQEREAELRRLEGNPTCALGQAPADEPSKAVLKAQANLSRKLNARLQTEVRSVAKDVDGEISREFVEETTIRSDFRYAQFFVERTQYRICRSGGCETAVCLKRKPVQEQIQQDLKLAESELSIAFHPFKEQTISFSNLESSWVKLRQGWSRYRELAALQRVIAGPLSTVDVQGLYQRFIAPAQNLRAQFQAMPFLVHVASATDNRELSTRVAGGVVADLGRRRFSVEEAGASCGQHQGKLAYHLMLRAKTECSVGFVGPTCTLHLSPTMTNCHRGQRYPLPALRFQGLATTMEKARSKALLEFDLKGRAALVRHILGQLD
ncbi:MAG: hypothetical protein CMH58_07055 [Myxococcales bacterium]|nr:hypothetical protein [Myxococcales bacterium]